MLNYQTVHEVFLQTLQDLANPQIGLCLPWWPRFQQYLGGLRPRELTLICAPTGAGKTQLLANITIQLLGQQSPLFIAPVETGGVDFMTRILSILDRKDLNQGDRIPTETLDLILAKRLEAFKKAPIYISTFNNRVELEEMLNTLTYMHQVYGVKVALLDNLNFFLKVVSAQNERAEMDTAVHSFLESARRIGMHIVLIMHPRKTDGGRVESEFDIKGSSLAVQESDNVILFNRPKAEDVQSGKRVWSDRELVFKKIRKRGQYINIPIWFRHENMRLEEFLP